MVDFKNEVAADSKTAERVINECNNAIVKERESTEHTAVEPVDFDTMVDNISNRFIEMYDEWNEDTVNAFLNGNSNIAAYYAEAFCIAYNTHLKLVNDYDLRDCLYFLYKLFVNLSYPSVFLDDAEPFNLKPGPMADMFVSEFLIIKKRHIVLRDGINDFKIYQKTFDFLFKKKFLNALKNGDIKIEEEYCDGFREGFFRWDGVSENIKNIIIDNYADEVDAWLRKAHPDWKFSLGELSTEFLGKYIQFYVDEEDDDE